MENNSMRDQLSVIQQQEQEQEQEEDWYLPDLPQGCIAEVISFTSPRYASVSACVSKDFRSAADSDGVWEKFLPPDYIDIFSTTVPPLSLTEFSSKKELYIYLCNDRLLLDGRTKSINLDKDTGKKCIIIGARELSISWVDNSEYWKWRPDSESRFADVVELIGVCWFQMSGRLKIQMLSRKTTYGVYLVMKHTDVTYGLEEEPIGVWVTLVGGGDVTTTYRHIYLERSRGQNPRPIEGVFPSPRGDGWMEIDMGDVYIDQGEDGEVQMLLLRNGDWKRGLVVEGIQLRPKAITS